MQRPLRRAEELEQGAVLTIDGDKARPDKARPVDGRENRGGVDARVAEILGEDRTGRATICTSFINACSALR